MFCSKCGYSNADDAAFCVNCGAALGSGNAQPAAQTYVPLGPYSPQAGFAAPKKSKSGLIAGVIAGSVVLVAAVVILVILLTGTAITGQWYSDELGVVLDFTSGGTVTSHTSGGTAQGSFTYDGSRGEGMLYADGETYEFEVYGHEMNITGIGIFTQAGTDMEP